MTLTNESLELLRTDTSGRVRTAPERREALLDEFERSGLSGMRFAARYGLKYPTFASWAARRRKERMGMEEQKAAPCAPHGAAAPVKPVRWLEAVTDDAASAPVRSVMLHLPGGVRMEVAHADQAPLAAALLRALSAGTSPAGGGRANSGPSSLRVKTASLPPSC